jgi:hypothetical protein
MYKTHFSFMVLGLLLICGVFHPAAARAAGNVGFVDQLTGTITIRHDGQSTASALKKGDNIAENDTVATSAHSRMIIKFKDGTELVMADHGSLVINKYIYDPAKPETSRAEYSILMAAFSYVGGLMDKVKKPDVTINLDLGSIGIRGTKILRAMKNGQCWVYLQEGKITVSNGGGSVTLQPGEGTIMTSKIKAPAKPDVWTDKKVSWMTDEVFGPPEK